MPSLVSAIVPNYNYAKFLPQRLKSIQSQTHQNIELIILDDASTDESAEVIRSLADHGSQVIYNRRNSGSPFIQWQKGIEASQGDYIWIAEADDCCSPELVSTLAAVLDDYPNVGLAYCQSKSIDASGNILGSFQDWTDDLDDCQWNAPFLMEGSRFVASYLLFKCVIPNASAVIFRKSILNSSYLPPRSLRCYGDWFFYAKFLRHTNIFYTPLALNQFRQHPNNQRLNQQLHMFNEHAYIVRSFAESYASLCTKEQSMALIAYHEKRFKDLSPHASFLIRSKRKLQIMLSLLPLYRRIYA